MHAVPSSGDDRLHSRVELMRTLADRAGTLAMRHFQSMSLAVHAKPDASPVTEADLEIEALLREQIAADFPDDGLLGEEHGAQEGTGSFRWVIDPIDGTTNFVKGNPVFATLIGVSVGGADTVGVISAPALGSRWDGVVGEGARQDGRRIEVSPVATLAAAEISLGQLAVLERGHPGVIAALAGGSGRQRGFGDFWAYGLLAAGSTDVVVEADLRHWDLCAPRALVLAAGGRVSDLAGRDGSDGGSALASNGRLHAEVLALLAAHARS
jgi:histidinol-phosphatase